MKGLLCLIFPSTVRSQPSLPVVGLAYFCEQRSSTLYRFLGHAASAKAFIVTEFAASHSQALICPFHVLQCPALSHVLCVASRNARTRAVRGSSMSTDPPKIQILDDSPAREDAFGGTHKRIADAIQDLVDNEDGGKAIGLEGTWGSGKSTIVEMLKDALPNRVFVFDAWAHRGDPLRRVFLERLIDFLVVSARINGSTWEERKDRLSNRLGESTRKTSTWPGWPTLVVAITSLLMPLGAAFFTSAFKSGNKLPDYYAPLGLFLMVLPMCCVLVLFGPSLFLTMFRIGGRGAHQRKSGLMSFLVRTETDEKSTVQESSEPTSIEFEKTFSDLLACAAPTLGGRLLLVIDNLDRVPRETALDIWSTLRVFLEKCRDQSCEWRESVWVLVPYDRPALTSLWSPVIAQDEAPVQEQAANNAGPLARSKRKDLEPHLLGESFLQKTFQVRFEVPSLALVDWVDHLGTLLASALPGNPEAAKEFDSVVRLFRIWVRTRGSPTPRQLTLYVNDVSALYRVWHGRIPLRHMAYYVILRYQEGRDIIDELRVGKIPEDPYDSLLDVSCLADHLAAIATGADVEKARSVLLKAPIVKALSIGNVDDLRSLAARNGFVHVFEEVLESGELEIGATPKTVASVAVALESFREEPVCGHPRVPQLMARFCRKLVKRVEWSRNINPSIASGIAALMRLCNDAGATERLLIPILGKDVPTSIIFTSEVEFSDWLKAAAAILLCASSLGQERILAGGGLGSGQPG